ncbi:hypothetical protein HPB48_022618 [Haemaphysalis longicornis]|uniref:Uncharacterized protein n=1 Tax=Haemaphysalis longicornis TaxID=44386 RepID=A0A9J6G9B3_HAELO|nr:hypothetical protein HPB48_022618 [Haemaphysalis longicornis]
MPDTGGDRLCPMSRARPFGRAPKHPKVQIMRPRTSHASKECRKKLHQPPPPLHDRGNLPTTAPTTSCCRPSSAPDPQDFPHCFHRKSLRLTTAPAFNN